MRLSFNGSGNLHETVELSFEEFQQHFGTNQQRKEKIRTAVSFIKIFASCGCKAVYIAGSFVSTKKDPEDIDICFDLTGIDEEKLERIFPGFNGPNRYMVIGKIRRESACHLFTFNNDDGFALELLQTDRYFYPKGLVRINLEKEFTYDYK